MSKRDKIKDEAKEGFSYEELCSIFDADVELQTATNRLLLVRQELINEYLVVASRMLELYMMHKTGEPTPLPLFVQSLVSGLETEVTAGILDVLHPEWREVAKDKMVEMIMDMLLTGNIPDSIKPVLEEIGINVNSLQFTDSSTTKSPYPIQ